MPRTDNHTFLTQGKISKVILTMSIPTIISMLTTSIYNIVDTYFVGQLSTQATASVGLVFPVMAIIQAVGFFFGQGSGVFVSKQLGAKQIVSAEKMVCTSFCFGALLGLAITLLGLLFLNDIALLLGSTPTILPHTKTYLSIILLGAPFMCCSMILNNQMRFEGNARIAMYGLLVGAVSNVVLVPIFTFSLSLGLKGTAIATVISQILGFCALWIMSLQKNNIPVRIQNFSFDKIYFIQILKGGTPSLTRQGLTCVATLLLNVAAKDYGDSAIAGMSIVSRITFVIFAVILGVGQGFQPFCGFNYGAKLYKRVTQGYMFSIKISVLFLIFCAIVGSIFSNEIIFFLRNDVKVVEVGALAFVLQIIVFPLAAFSTMTNMLLQTTGKTLWANILASARNGLFFIPLILLLPSYFGLLGVQITQPLADVFSCLLAAILSYKYFKTYK